MSQILQSYYFLESPATWEVDNTVVTVMALMVCLALSHQRGATVVPTSHRRKPRQGKEMQSLLLWRSVFVHYPYMCRAAQKLKFTPRSASSTPLATPGGVRATPRFPRALTCRMTPIRRRVHGSPMHTYVNMHPGPTLLDSRLKVGKGVQIKGSKSNSCLFFFSLHPQSTSSC